MPKQEPDFFIRSATRARPIALLTITKHKNGRLRNGVAVLAFQWFLGQKGVSYEYYD